MDKQKIQSIERSAPYRKDGAELGEPMNFEIFDTHLEAILVLSEDEKIIYCNEVFAQICDMSRRKIMGKIKFKDLISFENHLTRKELNTISAPTPYVECLIKIAGQKEHLIQYTIQKLENQDHWLVYFKDVTLEERLQEKYRGELQQKEGVISQLEQAKVQLEDYSKNLELKVQERSEEILKLNVKMKALLDSLTQGFLIFNQTGDCLEVYSQACQSIFKKPVAGTKIWDLFHLNENKSTQFQKWMTTLFSEMLPFDDLKPLGPEKLLISDNTIALDYYPLRTEVGMEGVVVVASDITNLIQAQKLAQQEKVKAHFILQIVTCKTQFALFVEESQQMLSDLHGLSEKKIITAEDKNEIQRILHTLKGGASIYSLPDFPDLCHHAEEQIKMSHETTQAMIFKIWNDLHQDFSRHIHQAKLILNERFLSKTKWYEIYSDQVATWLKLLNHESLKQNTMIREFTRELQHIGDVKAEIFFEPYRELTDQLAKKLGKSLKPLMIQDHQIRIPTEPYSQIFGTFVHLIRNAVDHGIETREERLQAGKSEDGQLKIQIQKQLNEHLELTSFPQSQELLKITIEDDGKGISAEVIKALLIQKFPDQTEKWNSLSEQTIIEMIFTPEFSTQSNVTDISGRGIGLDAVKFVVEEVGGKIEVSTQLGKGSEFRIFIPANLHLSKTAKVPYFPAA
ncbi:MAG: ATP-binding protein [Pseudobdellovibrionaceae bacterium]